MAKALFCLPLMLLTISCGVPEQEPPSASEALTENKSAWVDSATQIQKPGNQPVDNTVQVQRPGNDPKEELVQLRWSNTDRQRGADAALLLQSGHGAAASQSKVLPRDEFLYMNTCGSCAETCNLWRAECKSVGTNEDADDGMAWVVSSPSARFCGSSCWFSYGGTKVGPVSCHTVLTGSECRSGQISHIQCRCKDR